jgi:hypothetical protein
MNGYGCVNEHNGWVPRDFWLELWEKEAIIKFHLKNPLEGYRRLTFMMLDADVAAVSPASVWRVLKQAGLLSRWKSKPSRKGTGFEQPMQPHQHWHIDVTGSARARLAHGLKLDDLELSCPVLIGGSGSMAFPYQTPSPILRDWRAARSTAASGGTCKRDLPLRTPQRGSDKSEQSQ